MRLGLPIVATDVGGVAEAVDPGVDTLVESGSVSALAEALVKRLQAPARHT